MSRSFFRWLRGELNGFYLTSLYDCLNKVTEEAKHFLITFSQMQFERDRIDSVTLEGLGIFTGVFLPRIAQQGNRASMLLTSPEISQQSYSEKGLLNTFLLTFRYITYTVNPDINTLATMEERSSMTGDLDEIKGYIPSSAQNVTFDDGTINPDIILETPPGNEAYTDYYGDSFTYLSEAVTKYEVLEPILYRDLIEIFQQIRYNGMSLSMLCALIDLITPDGFVKLVQIQIDTAHQRLIAIYNLDISVDIDYKYQRLSLLEWAVHAKFPRLAWTPLT